MATSPNERMVFRASQELHDQDVVFVGIGLPNLACNLARSLHAPQLFMIYEAGAVGAVPDRLPISIGDPALVTGSLSVVSQGEIFQSFLQRGLIEVGFLGGAQIDRFGNINSTVIGPYDNPKVRLPGSGGACEIATHAKRLLVVMKMSPKSFVEKCDFVTSPGHRYGEHSRSELGLPGGGPELIVTDLCVFRFVKGVATVTELFEGVSIEDVQAQCGWKVDVASQIQQIPTPSQEIAEKIRALDPQRLYL